jgi:hypothetical protein
MNVTEYFLSRLSEEASELIKECCKAQVFGLDDHAPNDPPEKTNRSKIVDELNDLVATADFLATTGAIPRDWQCAEKKKAKMEKLVRFMGYSRNKGTVHEPLDCLRINIKCVTPDGTGSCTLDVIDTQLEDDGSITAVTSHWPENKS